MNCFFRVCLLLLFTVVSRPSVAEELNERSLRIPGYDTAGYVGDLNASRLFSAVSILAAAIENKGQDEILLLLFIGQGIIDRDRIAEFGLQSFTEEQVSALSSLEFRRDQCNLMRLDSYLDQEVHLLALDTLVATDAELERCILVLLARTRGVPAHRMGSLTNRQLILEFLERL